MKSTSATAAGLVMVLICGAAHAQAITSPGGAPGASATPASKAEAAGNTKDPSLGELADRWVHVGQGVKRLCAKTDPVGEELTILAKEKAKQNTSKAMPTAEKLQAKLKPALSKVETICKIFGPKALAPSPKGRTTANC